MNNHQRAINEMNLINLPENEQNLIIKVIDKLSEFGHSGGSASFVFNWMKRWAKERFELDPEVHSMTYDAVMIANGLSPEDQSRIISYVADLFYYRPLSPLTGEDDEWYDFDDGISQNKREGSVFKGTDGRAYVSDGIVFYTPVDDYTGWIGFTCYESRVYIEEFPCDVEKLRGKRYFIDAERNHPLPEGIDPKVWIKMMHEMTRYGYDLSLRLRSNDVFVNRNEYHMLMDYLDGMTNSCTITDKLKNHLYDVIESLQYSGEDIFDLCSVRIVNGVVDVSQGIDQAHCLPVELKGKLLALIAKLKTSDEPVVLNSGHRQMFYCTDVQVPNRTHTTMVPYYIDGEQVYMLTTEECEPIQVDFRVNNPVVIGLPDHSYLRQRRDALGLSRPNRKM